MQATLGGSLAVARAPARAVGSAAARATPFVAAARSAAPRSSRQQLRATATAAPEAPAAASRPEPSYGSAADSYAVVEIGGHQLVVEEGRWYTVNRLEVAPGSRIQLGRVLALKQGGQFSVGQPYVEGATVEAEVLEELQGPKVVIYKMKAKKHFRRKTGHRQPLTKILVTKIA
ncbi:50S ribosomal L21 [Chlorella sorokiniana]|uniref:50S ribosomal L21 n=1 Tax=Chlorella sorokiniana TaxID=3076 RepID=A0A2P6U419_CHLSO|nr:50S ribosomal L21 [Chlorella sorokiniana]|eukprot:PRW61049.1 50S ribosomal L21 [Chlorella sorokiniana]